MTSAPSQNPDLPPVPSPYLKRYWRPAVYGFLLGPWIMACGLMASVRFFDLPAPPPPTEYLGLIFSPLLVYFFLGGSVIGVICASGQFLPQGFGKRYGTPLWFLWLGLPSLFFFFILMAVSGGLSIERLIPHYYCIGLFLGFAVRERCRADKVPLTLWNRLVFCLVLWLPAGYVASEIWGDVNYARQRGHGFEYVGGYSDTNLMPYDPRIPGFITARLDAPATFTLKGTALPVLDGAQAAFPVYAAFALACYPDLPPLDEDTLRYHYDRHYYRSDDRSSGMGALTFTNTIRAFERLVTGKVDLFFGAQPSPDQMKLARQHGKELVLTPIGKEAFVFFVNEMNPVDGLSSEQLRKIYSGEISDWQTLGGKKAPVLAFQRPENSGSQTLMRHFMGDTPLPPPLMSRYVEGMGGVAEKVSEYRNAPSAIGYSFRFFLMGMNKTPRVKMLAVDGVWPTSENIASGSYPLVTALYAITVKGNPNPSIAPFLQWMTGEQGQELIEKTGYVRLRPPPPATPRDKKNHPPQDTKSRP